MHFLKFVNKREGKYPTHKKKNFFGFRELFMHQNDMHSANEEKIDLRQFKSGLIFDAEGVTLFGKYDNELAAWRAKKEWIQVLHDYFLLEPTRDYDIEVVTDLESLVFCLKSSFNSACGRYAFWRLINHQAPEAEKKLGGTINENSSATEELSLSGNESWIVNPLIEGAQKNKESAQILKKILKIFT